MGTAKSSIKKVTVRCVLCGADDPVFVTEGAEHEYRTTTDDVFKVVKCRHCGLHYLNPRPDVSELSTIYPPDYYAYHLQSKNDKNKNLSSPLYRARRYVYLSRLERALARCPGKGTLKVLDIGCADGRALNWYRQIERYKVETFGVDFDERAVDLARKAGHQVFQGVFETADIPENYFDLAVATHVIEHVAEPRCFIEKAFSALKPGGLFLIETPNIECLDARIFRNRHWGGYHFPRHWVFFSPKTLEALAISAGFQVEQLEFHPAPAFWNWTFHSLVLSFDRTGNGPFARLADTLFPPSEFQKNSVRNLIAVAAFTFIDFLQKAFTGKTSNMSLLLRKPG